MNDIDSAIDALEASLKKLKDIKAEKEGLNEFYVNGVKINFFQDEIYFSLNGHSIRFDIEGIGSLIERFNMKYRA